ncbi:unnamed protein product [Rangifer tarandus platyrhynchus]|uniref:Uncharacterized protein n=2 Tax=Rangifer tarandus platyrhynchus TaxID=3082113 RepID=A0AC60A5L8_RANTA|nr:unnamed protein product [Rangifer tarandus platyrhynchus]
MWTGGCCELRREPVPDPLEARFTHADGTRALGRCQPQPGIRLAALELPCMSVTPHDPCFTRGNLSPSPPTPQHCPECPARVRTQSHVSSSRTCHPLRHRADGPFSA